MTLLIECFFIVKQQNSIVEPEKLVQPNIFQVWVKINLLFIKLS